MLLRTSEILRYVLAAFIGLAVLDVLLIVLTIAALMTGDSNVQHVPFFDAQIRFLFL